MNKIRIDLNSFQLSKSISSNIAILATVKSFDLEAIRQRYNKSTSSNKNNKIGSVERRKPALGGLVYYRIENGKILEEEVLLKITEPRGIHSFDNKLAFSSDKTVYIIDNGRLYTLEDEWFSYIHTVEFSTFHNNRILISSSGLDCFFEFDYKKNEKIFEWFAWENGLDEGFDSTYNTLIKLTRDKLTAKKYNEENIAHVLIENPSEDYLPTAQRAAFINSVHYGVNEGTYIATLFHKGLVIKVNVEKHTQRTLIDNLSSPHGGQEISENQFIATDTRGGKFIEIKNGSRKEYFFNNLNANKVDGKNWIQNSHYISKDVVMSIDSNRNQFIFFNKDSETIQRNDFNVNWAIQDFCIAPTRLSSKEIKQLLNNDND